MKRSQYILITIIYTTLVLFINQILIYNVSLTNLRISLQSILWSLLFVYNVSVILLYSRKLLTISVIDYFRLFEYILITLVISLIFLILSDLIIIREVNIATYIKFEITLLIASIVVSLIYFLEGSFYKYRVLWILGFVGTIILAPLLVEAGMFVRDLRFKSLLDFWNWVVPYQAIEQLRQFVLLEGWQGWEVAVGSSIYLIAYWFVVASICLYIRQFQGNWKLPKVLR